MLSNTVGIVNETKQAKSRGLPDFGSGLASSSVTLKVLQVDVRGYFGSTVLLASFFSLMACCARLDCLRNGRSEGAFLEMEGFESI